MELGMIGLGRMGANMAQRLVRAAAIASSGLISSRKHASASSNTVRSPWLRSMRWRQNSQRRARCG